MIFSKERDLRLVTVRRGGTLKDDDHHLLAFARTVPSMCCGVQPVRHTPLADSATLRHMTNH